MGIILAPYDDSMRLGQGYNSFLHAPCVYDAVRISQDRIGQKPASSDGSVSQNVNYSSRFVDKMSDVVKSLNVSAGSSIKNGGIIGSRNSVTVDETKFAASDLNAIVSVKVVNQKTELLETAEFKAEEGLNLNSESFLKIYGNCFISGFVEGGELTGVVSAKVLDVENKTAVEEAIKGQVNSCCTSSGHKMDFTLSDTVSFSEHESAMRQTETTITVSWSGGGQIKPEEEEWTLESLYAAAAAFPSRVAQCPQRTWAILTPYNHTKNFVVWANDQGIRLPQFETAQVYADDLLDMYMEYKSCVKQIQTILENPDAYLVRAVENAVGTGIGELIKARTSLKAQMKAINQTIDKLALRPEDIDEIEKQHPIEAPELWAARLPIRKDQANETPGQATGALSLFSFESSDAEPAFVSPDVEAYMSTEEKAEVWSPYNRKTFSHMFFDKPIGKHTNGFFCDALEIDEGKLSSPWPDKFCFYSMLATDVKSNVTAKSLAHFSTDYGARSFGHGRSMQYSYEFQETAIFEMRNPDEYVTRLVMYPPIASELASSITYMVFETNKGNTFEWGIKREGWHLDLSAPPNCGLVGFYGASDSRSVYRLGPIWRKSRAFR
ncbi:hypothetical protein NW755_011575 [Fusarium falciforme]|uniref:Uncharacterized protein n=1 Tax=Fusarium falciforme TaxID=195108 RepID=A0A9W8UWV0_9HYPO|nr:hypothetical protein NW755_011575 [Fusarium falciforme]